MVMECVSCGDLYKFLHESSQLDWQMRIRISLDIALGMRFLHALTPPLIHRDLKSPNILVRLGSCASLCPSPSVLFSCSCLCHYIILVVTLSLLASLIGSLARLNERKCTHRGESGRLWAVIPASQQRTEGMLLALPFWSLCLGQVDIVVLSSLRSAYLWNLQEDAKSRAVANPTWLAPEVTKGESYSQKASCRLISRASVL
jgi:serine/threonine protein kinase